MRDLLLRTGNDESEVRGALRIIDYFDRLVTVHADTETLIREASALAGVPVGYRRGDIVWRSLPSGVLTDRHVTGVVSEERQVDGRGLVWREAGDGETVHAGLVLERLGLALEISLAARPEGKPVSPVEILLSAPLDGERQDLRERAWSRLRLEPDGLFRAVAVPLTHGPAVSAPHALVETPDGPLFGVIVRDGSSWSAPGGVGVPRRPGDLHLSWRAALLARRLAAPDGTFWADDLGVLLPMLESAAGTPEAADDAAALTRALDRGWTRSGLRALADGESVRTIARVEGLHHSTVQARIGRIGEAIGFDPTTSLGRTRLGAALLFLGASRDAGSRDNVTG